MKSIFSALLLLLFTVIASADPALVIRTEGGCALFDGDGAIVSGDLFGVVTRSTPGTIFGKCTAKGLDNSTGVAVHYDGYNNPLTAATGIPVPCIFDDGSGVRFTFDWHETVSAAGNAQFVCLIRD